jgi:primary-amine oxidase
MANDRKLDCDSLGSIYYKDGLISDEEGRPKHKLNAVCIHEQDLDCSGNIRITERNVLSWLETGNCKCFQMYMTAVSNSDSVLQSIITVSNYEYILAFIFNQAGEMMYEVRATGILSTQPIDEGSSVPWGTVVHDGVLATDHQHIMSLRIDPELDGDVENRLVYEEAHALPRDPKTNSAWERICHPEDRRGRFWWI